MTSHQDNAPPLQELNTLVALFNQCRYSEAENLARKMTVCFPRQGFAWKVLGAALKSQGRLTQAMEPMQKAAGLLPQDAGAHSNLGVTLRHLGRLEEAEASHRRALQIKPDFAEAWNNLGSTLKDMGRLEEAAEYYRRALDLKDDFADAYFNLGNTLNGLGHLEEAEASCCRALQLKPDYAEALCILGAIYTQEGRLDEAAVSYRRALELKPDIIDAYSDLGKILKQLGRLEEAAATFRRALELRPDFAEAYNSLGSTLKELGRLDEAADCCRRALQINPDLADAYHNLGNILRHWGQLEETEAIYRRALEISPDFTEAHTNLGKALRDMCRLEEAAASFQRAVVLKPDALGPTINAHLMLPIIHETKEAAAGWYAQYNKGIERLKNVPGSLKAPAINCNPLSFYLAYHNRNDRAVMVALNDFFRERVPELTATAPHIQYWSAPAASGRRIRVGFLSEFLMNHTIGKLYQGFISLLDRKRFDVLVIHTPKAKRDDFSKLLNSIACKSLTMPVDLAAQQAAIAAEKLDILFFPEIGMAPTSYFLAYARLAPVQVVSWGHPDTTGLATMDYFVSAAAIEPEDAEEHYAERLIRFNRLPCFYQPLVAPTQVPSRITLGLPGTGTLYGCPQNLFKFHPDFDAVLASIALGDPTGYIVLLEGKYRTWTNLLRARWAKSFPILLERVLFLPRMQLGRFMALMAHLDVVLDPIHFGSGNTLYEAMVYGTPIVTWPGRFMRGRIVAGAYRQMGIADAPIAASLEEYAPLALALGRDPERRRAFRKASLEAARRELFADLSAMRELEVFLEAAVEAADRGKMLPTGWRPVK